MLYQLSRIIRVNICFVFEFFFKKSFICNHIFIFDFDSSLLCIEIYTGYRIILLFCITFVNLAIFVTSSF